MKFLYIIQGSLKKTIGFGITKSPRHRLNKYVSHMEGEPQEFAYLYYGPDSDIHALEKFIKNEWYNIRKNTNGAKGWVTEWIENSSGKTISDLLSLVDYKIITHHMTEVGRVKAEFLPFKNYYSKTEISSREFHYNPEQYLDFIGRKDNGTNSD